MPRPTLALMAAGAALAALPSAASAAVTPGAMTFTKDAQCTANFVFSGGGATYLGQAAHCASLGDDSETDGCHTKSLPLGTPVTIDGASKQGTLAYSSWLTMQQRKETDPNACADNDLALIKIDPADVTKVQSAVPALGGPSGLAALPGSGSSVTSYGNSSLRGGLSLLSPKFGVVTDSGDGGWGATAFTLTPGIPGDSGSGFLDAQGRAIGVLSTLSVLPVPGTNGVGSLSKELAYAQNQGGMGDLRLVLANGSTAGADTAPRAATRTAAASPAKAKHKTKKRTSTNKHRRTTKKRHK